MQADSDLHMFFTKVDGSYPGRHKDLQPIITWKSSTTPVSNEFRLPIPVEHSGSVVDYSFETLHNDIQFAVLFEDEDGGKDRTASLGDEGYGESEHVIVERQRCDSHIGPVTGTIPLTRPGRLTLVWDNGHSWFKHKILSYSVTLHVPGLLATETAKCSRAVSVLGTCVRDRDRARVRRQDAASELEEVDGNVKLLEDEMRELKARLDEECQQAEQLWREVDNLQQTEHLEGRKIRGLTFRLMPEAVLALTLSFGSKDDQFLSVCKDWIDAVLPGPARTHVGSGSERDEQD